MAAAFRSFLAELKRRRVYHVGVAYIAVGLGVLGAAELILDPLGLTTLRPVIVILTLLGFPIALVLAWAYEVRPEAPAPTHTAATAGAAPASVARAGEGIGGDGDTTPSPGRDASATQPAAAAAEKSIAVLPFNDLSPEGDQEYFVHGLSEEIINALTQVRDLKVAARTSTFAVAQRNADVAAIAGTLGVANILEGSVRKAGERIRVMAQLIDARSGFHLWSDTFDRQLTDIFEIQDEIARAITGRLQITLAPKLVERKLVAESTENREAHEAYLRGRHLLNQRSGASLRRAITEFQRAVSLDPKYAEAFAGLAEAYLLVDGYTPTVENPHFRTNLERGVAAARTAASLAPELGVARLPLGMGLWCIGQWESARREMGMAVEMNPGYALGHMGLHVVTFSEGRPTEALQHARRAAELDPVSPIIALNLALPLYAVGRTEEALARFHTALELGPGLWNGWFLLAVTLLELGRLDEGLEAWASLGRVFQVKDDSAWNNLYRAAIRWHQTGEPQPLSEPVWTPPVMNLVWLYAHTGHPERAIQLFDEQLVQQGAYGWAALTHRLACAPLRDHPRHQALLRKMAIAP